MIFTRWLLSLTAMIGLETSGWAGTMSDSLCPDLSMVRSSLKHHEVLLEYSLGDSVLVILAITKSHKIYVRQRVDRLFRETIRNYAHNLRMANVDKLAGAAWKMYTMLLLPVRKILEGKSRLIIIPCRELNGIAFESFLTSELDPQACGFPCHHYLIRDFEVTYHYSVEQWLQITTTGRIREREGNGRMIDFAGFSPGFENGTAVAPIPAAGNEVAEIADLFGRRGMTARMSTGKESSKQRFLEMVPGSRIIHIATHRDRGATLKEENGLLFSDSRYPGQKAPSQAGVLTLEEIHGMKLRADLVVLNACGSAVCRKGSPGFASAMPAGFLGAGAKNILATLWNITDKFAGRFMVIFYRKWLSGMSFSCALRETKIEMIESRETALPTLWAAWVLIGR